MLLRRITEHVKAQNWTAVALDFVIVVVGVFMGIQLGNWNEARSDSRQEAAILLQLETEFSEIKEALEKQTSIREGYTENLASLIKSLEGSGEQSDDEVIKKALIAARSTGRRPAQSAAYLQLTANGDLARLSNEDLKQALIQYHARLERDAFIFPELMRTVVEEMSTNASVDYDVHSIGTTGAAIDRQVALENQRWKAVRSYDFEGLREHEQRYEALYLMHHTLVDTDKTQIDLANEILAQISKGR